MYRLMLEQHREGQLAEVAAERAITRLDDCQRDR